MENDVRMGKLSPMWEGNGNMPKDITFCVTEDCNLACKYCYMTGKNHRKKMTFEIAKKAVDYILNDKENFNNKSVIWNFIGGEPTIEMELIDKISDYIKQQMFLLDHPWFNAYRFNFSSNGILYDTSQVQNYIKKNRGHISFGISLDGNEIKHNLQRVYPDGSGSYNDVVRNIPLWIEQFGNVSTKATFSHDDLPYLKDSIISIWDLGIKTVAANVVFENVWEEGDDEIYESQLKGLADYVIENKLWNEYSVRFFDPNIGFPLMDEDKDRNFCGAGKMLAIDCEGKLYPCIRFLDFSLNNRKGLCIGDINIGINNDKLRPFYGLNVINQSKKECIECDVATGCAWCTGCNYDNAETDTIYKRATYICKMHKANVRACEYFWNRYSDVTGEKSRRDKIREERENIKKTINKIEKIKYLQFLTDDNVTPHCIYKNISATSNVMSDEVINKGLEYAEKNGLFPVFIGNQGGRIEISGNRQFIVSSSSKNIPENAMIVYDNALDNIGNKKYPIGILPVSKKNISKIYELVNKVYKNHDRINIILQDIELWNDEDIEIYKEGLEKLSQLILSCAKDDYDIEINVLTDRLNLKSSCDCDAGNESITLAPNGRFYICPAFYFDNPNEYIGDTENGLNIRYEYLLRRDNSTICSNCDAYQCLRCKFLNKKMTGEINTPSKIQCMISHIERNISKELQKKMINLGYISENNIIEPVNYNDPFDKVMKKYRR